MPNISKKRILFVGMPDMAFVCLSKLIDAGFNIVGVVPPHKTNNTYSFFCQYVKSVGLNLVEYESSMKDVDFIAKVRKLKADIAVVCSYDKLFPKEFLCTTKDGFINTHPSLLPKYRGPNPYSHVILAGETETGVTFHLMDEKFDTGDIIVQYKVPVDSKETMGTLFNKLNYIAGDALIYVLNYYEENGYLPRKEQPEGVHVYAYSISPEKGNNIIDWNKTCQEISTFIRALNPFISAAIKFRGQPGKVHTSYFKKQKTKFPPGTICSLGDSIGVTCLDGVLYIKTLQIGSYIIGDAKDFIEIFVPKIGEKFE